MNKTKIRAGGMDAGASIICVASLAAVLAGGCIRYDIPAPVIHALGTQMWAVGLSRSGSRYRVTSTTRLNGSGIFEKGEVSFASGSVGDWKWAVRAAPSLLPSLRAWRANPRNKRIRLEAERSGNWLHTTGDWDLAFQRAYRVARYLLGRVPPAMRATIFLVPSGSAYSARITSTETGYFPVILGFYWPPSPSGPTGPKNLITSVTRTVYEYQHLLVDAGFISPAGRSAADRTAVDEARSQCWSDSTFLALVAGTPSSIRWRVSRARAALGLLQDSERRRTRNRQTLQPRVAARNGVRFQDAYLWGRLFETQSVGAYLRSRGMKSLVVRAQRPEEMNSLLSVCRAMTQHPVDLTAGPYPVSQIRYVPFFPASPK